MLGVLVLHALLAGAAAALLVGEWLPLALAAAFGFAVSLAASLRRYPRVGAWSRGVTTALYGVYFVARGLSPYVMLSRAARASAWRQRPVT